MLSSTLQHIQIDLYHQRSILKRKNRAGGPSQHAMMIDMDSLIMVMSSNEPAAAPKAAKEGPQPFYKYSVRILTSTYGLSSFALLQIASKLLPGLKTAAAMQLVLLQRQHIYNDLFFQPHQAWKVINTSLTARNAADPFDEVSKRFCNFVVD